MNYVIYHRNNRTLEITNHIDKDGDLDPNYVMLRNTGLTGNKQRMKWLIECATNGCPICSAIFEPNNPKFVIKKWYIDNVVKPQIKAKKDLDRKIKADRSKTNKFDKYIAKNSDTKTKLDPDQHPLYDLIIEKFTNHNKEK